ncbi:hypothetical protein [Sphaerisporangium sp. NPDC051011]|uniref:hypothetical protein n=1 Tax=Sphaerisporangium sp. NPDC051011 TaxID=3155792 RepID=UPI0033EA41F6
MASLDVKALPLQVAVWLPDLRIAGALRDGKAIGVGSLLESFGIPAGELPAGLAISDLSFAADLGDAYIVRMKVTGSWSIAPFTITSLSLELAYNEVEKFVATVAGTVMIGSSLSIEVSATRSGGATGGWAFRGGLAAGEALGMAEMVAALGLADVPEPVKSLELTSLWISHTTGTAGVFDFICRGDMMIADGVRASLGVTATHDGSGTRYGGTLEIAGYAFDVIFDKDKSGTDVFAATFRGAQDGIELEVSERFDHDEVIHDERLAGREGDWTERRSKVTYPSRAQSTKARHSARRRCSPCGSVASSPRRGELEPFGDLWGIPVTSRGRQASSERNSWGSPWDGSGRK